ncbi:MAG: patatin-like phospholipase family protein, partial [Planctomycetota bacterium JB042]
MTPRPTSILLGSLLGALLSACASTPERQLSEAPAQYAMLPNGRDPLNPDRPAPAYEAAAGGHEKNVARRIEALKGRPLNVLSISGGGQNGAFGAGFLVGWRESGRRPEFDAVVGVSTGALMATHALLGTPEDDAVLEQIYTQVSSADIYEERSIF